MTTKVNPYRAHLQRSGSLSNSSGSSSSGSSSNIGGAATKQDLEATMPPDTEKHTNKPEPSGKVDVPLRGPVGVLMFLVLGVVLPIVDVVTSFGFASSLQSASITCIFPPRAMALNSYLQGFRLYVFAAVAWFAAFWSLIGVLLIVGHVLQYLRKPHKAGRSLRGYIRAHEKAHDLKEGWSAPRTARMLASCFSSVPKLLLSTMISCILGSWTLVTIASALASILSLVKLWAYEFSRCTSSGVCCNDRFWGCCPERMTPQSRCFNVVLIINFLVCTVFVGGIVLFGVIFNFGPLGTPDLPTQRPQAVPYQLQIQNRTFVPLRVSVAAWWKGGFAR